MFTRTIFDDGVQNFDSGHEMEKALMHLIATSQNVDEDWPAYVDAINQALPVAAVSKTVNDYAKANHITSEE